MNDESAISLDDPHCEFRRCHRGGAIYLGVESALWLTSATLGATGQIPAAMLTFVVLAIVTVCVGIAFGFVFTVSFATCGFVVAGVFLVFAFVHYATSS